MKKTVFKQPITDSYVHITDVGETLGTLVTRGFCNGNKEIRRYLPKKSIQQRVFGKLTKPSDEIATGQVRIHNPAAVQYVPSITPIKFRSTTYLHYRNFGHFIHHHIGHFHHALGKWQA